MARGVSLDISEYSHCHTDRLRMMVTRMNKELWVIYLRAVYTMNNSTLICIIYYYYWSAVLTFTTGFHYEEIIDIECP